MKVYTNTKIEENITPNKYKIIIIITIIIEES